MITLHVEGETAGEVRFKVLSMLGLEHVANATAYLQDATTGEAVTPVVEQAGEQLATPTTQAPAVPSAEQPTPKRGRKAATTAPPENADGMPEMPAFLNRTAPAETVVEVAVELDDLRRISNEILKQKGVEAHPDILVVLAKFVGSDGQKVTKFPQLVEKDYAACLKALQALAQKLGVVNV